MLIVSFLSTFNALIWFVYTITTNLKFIQTSNKSGYVSSQVANWLPVLNGDSMDFIGSMSSYFKIKFGLTLCSSKFKYISVVGSELHPIETFGLQWETSVLVIVLE